MATRNYGAAIMTTSVGNAWQRSDVREALMLEMIQDGVTVRNSDGRLLQCNGAAERLLGLDAAELDGWTSENSHWSMIQPDGTPCAPSAWPDDRALHSGRPVRDVILGINRPGARLVWLRISSTPFVEGDGSVSATLTTFTDVTPIIESGDDATRSGRGDGDTGTLMFDRRRLEHAIEQFDGALARMSDTLENERQSMRTVRLGLDAGLGLSASLDEDGISAERDNLTTAIVDLEGARRAIRVQMFRALMSEGKSIGEIARIWGISRQLASRILRDARDLD